MTSQKCSKARCNASMDLSTTNQSDVFMASRVLPNLPRRYAMHVSTHSGSRQVSRHQRQKLCGQSGSACRQLMHSSPAGRCRCLQDMHTMA
jgi:hypothetical protein